MHHPNTGERYRKCFRGGVSGGGVHPRGVKHRYSGLEPRAPTPTPTFTNTVFKFSVAYYSKASVFFLKCVRKRFPLAYDKDDRGRDCCSGSSDHDDQEHEEAHPENNGDVLRATPNFCWYIMSLRSEYCPIRKLIFSPANLLYALSS